MCLTDRHHPDFMDWDERLKADLDRLRKVWGLRFGVCGLGLGFEVRVWGLGFGIEEWVSWFGIFRGSDCVLVEASMLPCHFLPASHLPPPPPPLQHSLSRSAQPSPSVPSCHLHATKLQGMQLMLWRMTRLILRLQRRCAAAGSRALLLLLLLLLLLQTLLLSLPLTFCCAPSCCGRQQGEGGLLL